MKKLVFLSLLFLTPFAALGMLKRIMIFGEPSDFQLTYGDRKESIIIPEHKLTKSQLDSMITAINKKDVETLKKFKEDHPYSFKVFLVNLINVDSNIVDALLQTGFDPNQPLFKEKHKTEDNLVDAFLLGEPTDSKQMIQTFNVLKKHGAIFNETILNKAEQELKKAEQEIIKTELKLKKQEQELIEENDPEKLKFVKKLSEQLLNQTKTILKNKKEALQKIKQLMKK